MRLLSDLSGGDRALPIDGEEEPVSASRWGDEPHGVVADLHLLRWVLPRARALHKGQVPSAGDGADYEVRESLLPAGCCSRGVHCKLPEICRSPRPSSSLCADASLLRTWGPRTSAGTPRTTRERRGSPAPAIAFSREDVCVCGVSDIVTRENLGILVH